MASEVCRCGNCGAYCVGMKCQQCASKSPTEIAVFNLAKELTAATARAEKAEAERDAWKGRYDKAWEECRAWRYEFGYTGEMQQGRRVLVPPADAHDAARREAGL